MKVFVTGGSGFVGGEVIELFTEDGHEVRGLARSDGSAGAVKARGGEVVRGDLAAVDAMTEGMAGCDVVVHAAALVDDFGDRDEFLEVNVGGTEAVIEAATAADVDRLIHVSTEAVLADGSPIVQADESAPIPDSHIGLYPETKAMAERVVRAANGDGLETIIVRPRFVWGVGDRTLLPQFIEAVESGDFRWFDGGDYLTSTCHVRNIADGIRLAAENGDGGETYFFTDGDPVQFRDFFTKLFESQGVDPPEKNAPTWLVGPIASVSEFAWRYLPLPGDPVLTRTVVGLFGQEVTVDDSKAREELGYDPPVTIEEGIEELHEWDSL